MRRGNPSAKMGAGKEMGIEPARGGASRFCFPSISRSVLHVTSMGADASS